ncbi:hypothetical protein HK098_002801 [Nowakowskiella sp. JEL0407]|nr:hypothetical protein HK098_002801 [Nowakowskiella sp. JEL0407]
MNYNLSPLHIAAPCGNVALVKLLLSFKEVDPNAVTEHGINPLHIACREDHEEIAQLLLKRTKNPHVLDLKYRTPLVYCVAFDSINCAKVLHTNDPPADPNSPDTRSPAPQHYCSKSSSKVLRYLRECGVDVTIDNAENSENSESPLTLNSNSVIYSKNELISENSENVNTPVAFHPIKAELTKKSIIMSITLAVSLGLWGTVDDLLGDGVDVTTFKLEFFYITLKRGATTICHSRDFDQHLAFILLSLMTYGFDPNTPVAAQKNETILHYVCQRAAIMTVQIFLAYGANASLQDSDGEIPFSLACKYGHYRIVILIVDGVSQSIVSTPKERTTGNFKLVKFPPKDRDQSTDKPKYFVWELVKLQNGSGITALMSIVDDDERNVTVKYLIRARTDINVKNKDGNTALHIALTAKAYRNVINILREESPDIRIRNNEGKAAQDLVEGLGNDHAVVKGLQMRKLIGMLYGRKDILRIRKK